jgi:hypothetical protein
MASDLLVREAFYVVKHDDDALMIRELAQGAIEVHGCARAGTLRCRELVEQLGLTRASEPRIDRPDADGREPRREHRVARIAMESAASGKPRFLNHVVDFVTSRCTEEAHHDHAQPRGMSMIESAERRLVPAEKSTDERRVGEIGGVGARGHMI